MKRLILTLLAIFLSISVYSQTNSVIVIPYGDRQQLFNMLNSKFPARTNAYVDRIRTWNIRSGGDGLVTGTVYHINGELRIK